MSLPSSVDARINADYSGADKDAAAALLPRVDELPLNPPYERVLLAILTLAQGNLDTLRHYADIARSDWRDVLYWTEHPPDPDEPKTYEELLQRLGFPPDPEHH
jgi:hypothetical protein